MSDPADEVNAYTVRLELIDRPGELLRALEPIAENGGNLLSIFHERGNLTPRGQIPVEVDLEAPPAQFDRIVDALHDEDINVIQAGAERYSEELTVVLVGNLVSTDISDTIEEIQRSADATVTDLSLSAPVDENGKSSARLRLATQAGEGERALSVLREIGAEKGLRVIEPLTPGAGIGDGA
jgi:ACT domain-containing protein